MNNNPPSNPFADDDPKNEFDWQTEAEVGWEAYVGVSRDDPQWEMMEEIAVYAMFERIERD